MKETGFRNPSCGVEQSGLRNLTSIYWNQSVPALYELSLRREEGCLAANGPLVVDTGPHKGRSATDKFVVKDAETTDTVWWDSNKPISEEQFDLLYDDFVAHARGMELFAQDLFGGADPAYRLPVRVYTEFAWHSLFIHNLLRRPEMADLAEFVPELTIIDLPSFFADPAKHGCSSPTVIACNLSRKIILIGGTAYAGEIKKSVFTCLNYLLPPQNVLPMHCSVNVGDDGKSAIFFGLSGTGKTTLSADPARTLIGDDEHGWGESGVFNFEGGCYAKTIKLSPVAEPEIYSTTQRFGTVLENVVLDENRIPDLDDGSKTENTRAAYPIDFISNASETGRAPQPAAVIMLTADAFGVLPPIARLTPAQAMYHFLSGYTAKVAGTEEGVIEPQATFSTCFGAPFIPRHPSKYGDLLRDLVAKHGVSCWLVNTGWTSGAYGVGHRMPIQVTRTLLHAALDGSLNTVPFRTDPYFGFQVPESVPGVDTTILDPRATWSDKAAYDAQASHLVHMFIKNFSAFEAHVDHSVREAAPSMKAAAAE